MVPAMSCLKGEIAMLRLRNLTGILLLSFASVVVCAEEAEEQPVAAQQEMFAIAAEGQEASSPISTLSGRAPFFIIYDENGNLIEVAPNIYLQQEVNIGPDAAVMLGEKKVTVLVGGMAGPKMQKVLDAKGIRFVYRKGVVQQVVDELRQ